MPDTSSKSCRGSSCQHGQQNCPCGGEGCQHGRGCGFVRQPNSLWSRFLPRRYSPGPTPRFFEGRRPRLMAHRGASCEAPENTLPAFELAVGYGADILEMDVWLTADGHVVVCHDETVDRTTNGTGAIPQMTLAQVQALDAGYRFTADGGNTFPYRGRGVVIPTLQQVLEAFPHTPLNIEIKHNSDAAVRSTILLLERYGRVKDGSVIVAALDHDLIRRIRRFSRDVLTSTSQRESGRMLAAAWSRLPVFWTPGVAFQVPPKRGLLPVVSGRFVTAAHKRGLEVHVWTIDDEQQMRRLFDMGVDGLFTNNPALARRVIDAGSWR